MRSLQASLAVALAILFGSNIAIAQIDFQKSVLTQRNDNSRRGAYLTETKLTPATVQSSFGHLYSLRVRGPIVAQPLFAKGVNVGGTQKDVLYVATRMNNIHAFEVDDDVTPKNRELWRLELPRVPEAPINQPVTAVWRDQGHLDLFMMGSDGRILSNFWEEDRGWWHQWFPIRLETGIGAAGISQQITALWGDPNNPRHLNLFMVDKDGTVQTIHCTIQPDKPCWDNDVRWSSIGQPGIAPRGQPVTAEWRDDNFTHLDLFIVGKDGKVLSNFWEKDSGWHDWFAIGTATAAVGRPQEITAKWGDPTSKRR